MNEKWFAPDVSEIEKKLKTNAASGLSPRAARSRARKNGEGFFITPKRSALSMFMDTVSDFTIVLLIIASVAALCFGEYATGVCVLVILALNIGVTFFLHLRTQRFFESLEVCFHPSVTVIRGGKAYSVDSERVVEGDVVLLTAGDVLSFDARLITSDKLRVAVRVDRNTVVDCEKRAECRVSDVEYDIRNMPNMVHAGSVIKEGSARAIVTAVGKYTYYGAMTGGVVLNTSRKLPRGLRLLRKFCSSFSMVLTVAILPFSLLSLLFSHDKVTLLTTFTSILAIAASFMSGVSCTACGIFFERQARRALSSDEAPSVFRSQSAMDALMSADYLFLLDGSAASDGVLHFEKALCIEGEVNTFNAVSASTATLGELASLYDSAENRTLTMGIHTPGRFSNALSEFVEKTGVDPEALKIRCTVTGYVPGNLTDNTDKLFYLDGDIRYILNVSSSPSAVAGCNRTVVGNEVDMLSDEGKRKLSDACAAYVRNGKQILVFTLSDNVAADTDVKSIFAGVLVLSQRNHTGLKKAVSELASRGVRTMSFVNTSPDENGARGALAAPMLSGGVTGADFEKAGKPVTYNFGKISTYINMSDADIDKLIGYAHSMKKRVAVLSFTDRYKAFKEQADVFISVSALQYRFTGKFDTEVETLEVAGSAESLSCRQDIKSDAEVLIPRPVGERGGLTSLLSAFRSVSSAYDGLIGFFKYALCAQFLRIVTVLLPMMFGEAHLDARHVLFLGAVFDLFVLLVFVLDMNREQRKAIRRAERELIAPIRKNLGIIASAVFGALVAVILPHIIGNIGFMGRYLYETEYLFISTILLQLSLMYCVRISRARKKAKRGGRNKIAIALLAFLAVFVPLCFVIPVLRAAFDLSGISFWYLLLTLVPSAVCVLLFRVIGGIGIYRE